MGVRAATIAELRQRVLDIRTLARGEEITVEGKQIHMRVVDRPFPILISASQPRMLKLAGAVADGVIILGGVDRSLTKWQIDWVEAGAREAGRSLDDVFVDVWLGISMSDDLELARKEVRPYATSQARWFSRWSEHPEALKPFAGEFQKAYEAYNFYYHVSRQATHNDIISNELVDTIGVVGPVSRCVDQITPLFDLKIDRITFLSLPGGRERRLQEIADQLLPRLEQSMAAARG
jgi:5,10-methylenetetrahydromethanopterin reductase